MKTAIIGARGYLGRELVRLLVDHPHVTDVVPASTTSGGTAFKDSVATFTGHPKLQMVGVDDPQVRDADVVFLATAGGEAKSLLPQLDEAAPSLIVDLSRDHRLEAIAGTGKWTYGLAEVAPGTKKGATHVANPGCYPTASILSMTPAVAAGLATGAAIVVDGKSGVSGAGAVPRADLHYPEMHDGLRAYKVLGHDHEAEIEAACQRAGANTSAAKALVQFTPHLVPTSRGLLTTTYVPVNTDVAIEQVRAAYKEAYANRPFVSITDEAETKHVLHSNRAHIAVDLNERHHTLVVRAAIDNLLKGGAGAAVQNLNLALGLPETAGLPTIGATA